MLSIALEIKLECKSCGNMLPMNAMHTAYKCPSCMEETRIGTHTMADFYAEIIRRVTEEKDDRMKVTGNIIPFFLEGTLCIRLYGKYQPEYNRVKLETEAIAEAAAAGFITVKEQQVPVRRPPEWFAKKNTSINYLVGEDPDQVNHLPGDTRPQPEQDAQPVLFSCLSCGAGLPFKGDSRFITCTYCRNASYIPDALWLKFHPVARVRRWYMVG